MASPDLYSLPPGSMVMHLWDEESQSVKTTVIEAKREEERKWLNVLDVTPLNELPATLPIHGCDPFRITWNANTRAFQIEMCGDFRVHYTIENESTLVLTFTGGDSIECGLVAATSEITVPPEITAIRVIQHWWA